MSKEAVNHPQHYGGESNQYEAIKVIEAWELDFCLGNTVKYISRAGKKDNIVQDLKKLNGIWNAKLLNWKRLVAMEHNGSRLNCVAD
jgi:hypothetical protein